MEVGKETGTQKTKTDTEIENSIKSSNVIAAPQEPLSQFVDGFKIPRIFSAERFRSAVSYKPRPDDVILATYPKCGTTWAQYILLHIFRHGEPLESQIQFFCMSPYLEMSGAEAAEIMSRPGAIKVHLPYHLTPRSDSAKYIYIARNPKDCCVSYFHHMRSLPGHAFSGTFDDFFELFISGTTDYEDYFDHLLGWYEYRNDPNVLFMTYEEMKENSEEAVLKMASFINDKLYGEPLRNNSQMLQNVIKYSSFDYMKKVVNQGIHDVFQMSKEEVMKSDLPSDTKKMIMMIPSPPQSAEKPKIFKFVRKGIIGEWRNYFSEDQSRRLDEKFAKRTKGTEIPTLFKKYM